MYARISQAKTTEASSKNKVSTSTSSWLSAKPLIPPTLQLQQAIGKQNVQRLLRARLEGSATVPPGVQDVPRSSGQSLNPPTRAFMDSRFGHDFSSISVHKVPAQIQAKQAIDNPGDKYEQEANQFAERVMNMPGPIDFPPVQREVMLQDREEQIQSKTSVRQAEMDGSFEASNVLESSLSASKGGGSPLPDDVRDFMESRFGFDFAQVRAHLGGEAVRMCRNLNAQAFTHQQDIYFGAGKYPSKEALTAHELTHVLQQTGGRSLDKAKQRQLLEGQREGEIKPLAAVKRGAAAGQVRRDPGHVPSVQRVVEVRPPGRGEASAFGRRQELIDRLNAQSPAIQYWLDGRVLRYNVVNEGALTNFDRQMRGFIDRAEVAPLRLITRAGLVDGQRVTIDDFDRGYVDLDDMLASSDISFQMNLIHFLTERFSVRNYERRIGTHFSNPEFNRAHQAGIEAEAEYLRNVIGDATIRFVYEETRPNGTMVFGFRSDEGYRVFHVFRRGGQAERGGEVFVQTRDGRRLTIDQLRAERAAAAPAPVPAVP